MSSAKPGYIGRFAPSPSGPLHFGSAVAAIASFLDARAAGGQWIVRIDDLDPPRESPGAANAILHSLESLGLYWDGVVTYQSRNSSRYAAAIERLNGLKLTFPCACTRRELARGAYPGTCRDGIAPGREPRSVRVKVDGPAIGFEDRIQGPVRQDLASAVGDFILIRADGYYGYHLACVVDDARSGVTHVVRGVDLLDSTPRQLYLQRLLGLETPSYAHFPVVTYRDGTKLSKQTQAPAIDDRVPAATLCDALSFLNHTVPPTLLNAEVRLILDWAIEHWTLSTVRPQRANSTLEKADFRAL